MGTPAETSAQLADEASFEEQERASRRRRHVRQLGVCVAVLLIATGGIAWATNGFTRSAGGVLGSLGPQCPPTVALNGSGSTFIAPLMRTWVQTYSGAASTRERGCLVVLPTYNASGSETGLGQLNSGGTEFVATEEPLNSTVEAGFPQPTLTLPLAASAVAVTYDVPGIATGLNLTGAVLAGIFLGTITLWNDSAIAAANTGVTLPAGAPITVIHEANGSSTNYVFTGFLSASNATWASTVGQGSSVKWPAGISANGDAGAASLLETTSGSIAYLGLSTAITDHLTCAKVENPSGHFVAPSASSVFAAATAYTKTLPLGNQSWQNVSLLDQPGNTSYPITTFTYAIVYTDLGVAYHGSLKLNVAQWLAAFLYWMSVAGQSYVTPLGYAPFSQTVTSANQQIVELLRFDGVPALGDIDYDGD
jgi:phosphate ABC transporter phosphate-binding protein